jgi:transcriptional regulator with XRE-family HTH domain
VKIYDYRGKKNICGERVRELRLKKRMSQSELAAKLQICGISIERDSVSRIEIGTRFVADYEIMVLAEIFEVEAGYLVAGDRSSALI